jgi:hypothetical protein
MKTASNSRVLRIIPLLIAVCFVSFPAQAQAQYGGGTGEPNGDWAVGGLVGRNHREVTDCYSASTVSGDSSVGGLVGVNWVHSSRPNHVTPGLVARCYSTGVVSGTENVGGLVGSNEYSD